MRDATDKVGGRDLLLVTTAVPLSLIAKPFISRTIASAPYTRRRIPNPNNSKGVPVDDDDRSARFIEAHRRFKEWVIT